jgi:3-phenylpropionate/cinnamic acid dioxygenase small subunit
MTPEREIENLLYHYCELIDRGDFAGLGELFADGLHVSGSGYAVSGADDVLAYYQRRVRVFPDRGTPRTRHLTTNVIIEIDDSEDRAVSRSYFTVLQGTPDLPLQPIIAGRYEDKLIRDARGWRFLERRKFVELEGDLHEHLLWAPQPDEVERTIERAPAGDALGSP